MKTLKFKGGLIHNGTEFVAGKAYEIHDDFYDEIKQHSNIFEEVELAQTPAAAAVATVDSAPEDPAVDEVPADEVAEAPTEPEAPAEPADEATNAPEAE